MADMFFCFASLLFLVWVIRLKWEIDELKHEVTDLRERVDRHGKRAESRKKAAPQSAIWKGPALVDR